MKKTILLTSMLLASFLVLPTISKALDVNDVCPITLDNDTSDWAALDSLVSDGGNTIGTDYYWDGSQWLDEEPDSYEYSTNVEQMADIENIKMCNDMRAMYLYIDAQHPMFGIYDVAEERYHEFMAPEESEIGMPEEFDYWAVFQMQKQGSENIYYYAIHLYSTVGDPGLVEGPEKQALYEDDGDGSFNPNLDTELAEFESSDESLYEGDTDKGGKEFDQDGGMEVGLHLINADGDGLFTSTEIAYGDTLDVTAAMYPNSLFGVNAQSTMQSVEQTDAFEYQIAKVGVQNLRIKNKKKKKVTVKWAAITGASKYYGKVYKKKNGKYKYIRKFNTTATKKKLKKLKAGAKYRVKIRAKISDVKTPWSSKKKFKTKTSA